MRAVRSYRASPQRLVLLVALPACVPFGRHVRQLKRAAGCRRRRAIVGGGEEAQRHVELLQQQRPCSATLALQLAVVACVAIGDGLQSACNLAASPGHSEVAAPGAAAAAAMLLAVYLRTQCLSS